MRPLPKSQTDLGVSMLGFAAAMSVIALLRHMAPGIDMIHAALLVAGAAALPNLLADIFIFKRHREPAVGMLTTPRKVERVALLRKCAGLLLTLGGFGMLYSVFPEYDRGIYANFWKLVKIGIPVVIIAMPFYFYWCLRHLDKPWDGYDEMAELLLFRFRGRDWAEIGRHWRNWLVKAFFLPLMATFFVGSVSGLIYFDTTALADFTGIFSLAMKIIFMADLLYAAIGYSLTLRPLNAHIRSSDPTFRGWVVAVACYGPFWSGVLFTSYFNYMTTPEWDHVLHATPWLMQLWGCIIIALMTVYSLATICLGIRFSNLTYRGLITSGPYRFTKHPAYVSKNLSWWFISVPFMATGWHNAATLCLLLCGVHLIYYLRARTEELHLSNYPEYVEYALAMNERSVFRGLNKYLPFLEYKVPATPPKI